ncbi:MAG: FeoA family protein [Glaciecola sp.]
MTLWQLTKNKRANVDTLHESLNDELRTRLAEMGFASGEALVCKKRSAFNGPIVVQIQDCVYSLDKQLAEQILIKH